MEEASKGSVKEKIEQTVEMAEDAVKNPYVRKLAKLGFYTKGFLFIVIGILAIMVAIERKGGELADPSGALALISQAAYGKVILIIFIFGAFGHGLWNILRGVADVDNAGNKWQGIVKRSIAVGVGIFYMILAWSAWDIVMSTTQVTVQNGIVQKTLTAVLLALPLGSILVGLVGLIVIGAGVHECYSGLSGKFQESFRLREIARGNRIIIIILGVLSFTARALIFALMGYFFIAAAIDYNPNEAIGIDGALLALSRTYFGKTLLFVTAAGLVCHGILSLYEAKYRRIC